MSASFYNTLSWAFFGPAFLLLIPTATLATEGHSAAKKLLITICLAIIAGVILLALGSEINHRELQCAPAEKMEM